MQGIVNLGESLLLEVIAEGIEHQAQADELTGMRLPLVQGFLFYAPLAVAQIGALLATQGLRDPVPATPSG